MSYAFEYSDTFRQDYREALAYITGTLKNPVAAADLDDAFERAKLSLLTFPRATAPLASPPAVDTDYYALSVGNYLAFYVVLGDVIEFRRFLYAHSDLPNRLGI